MLSRVPFFTVVVIAGLMAWVVTQLPTHVFN